MIDSRQNSPRSKTHPSRSEVLWQILFLHKRHNIFDPLNKESSGELSFSSGSSRASSPMEKALSRRKHNFVRERTNDDDDEHDADNLVHGI